VIDRRLLKDKPSRNDYTLVAEGLMSDDSVAKVCGPDRYGQPGISLSDNGNVRGAVF
jgi:hypothetical protein